jgi:hypothetical protein
MVARGYIMECGMEWAEDRVGKVFAMHWKGNAPDRLGSDTEVKDEL